MESSDDVCTIVATPFVLLLVAVIHKHRPVCLSVYLIIAAYLQLLMLLILLLLLNVIPILHFVNKWSLSLPRRMTCESKP